MYDLEESRHHFNELQKSVDTIKSLTGPVYACDHKNTFQEIGKHAEKLQYLMGPVYQHGVDHSNHFQQITQAVHKIKNLTGPVYDVGHESHFADIIKVRETKLYREFSVQNILYVYIRILYL